VLAKAVGSGVILSTGATQLTQVSDVCQSSQRVRRCGIHLLVPAGRLNVDPNAAVTVSFGLLRAW
jgi:hypothetical protein